MNNTNTTCERFEQGAVDEVKYAAFVAKTERGMLRNATKGHRDFAGWTAEDCRKAANDLCAVYRHQFRTLVAA